MQKIGVICAGDKELAPFLPQIENATVTDKAMLKFYEGQINGVQMVALYSGVCKVNAAVATQILIDTYAVTAIINAGTAGGMDKGIELFDTVISTETAYHDVDDGILNEFHPWLPSVFFNADKGLLDIARNIFDKCPKIYFGRMVTGEKFIEDNVRDTLQRLNKRMTHKHRANTALGKARNRSNLGGLQDFATPPKVVFSGDGVSFFCENAVSGHPLTKQ